MKITSSTSKKQLKLSKPTNSSALKREFKKRYPKTSMRIEKKWDHKMLIPVMDFTMSILDNVNPRLKKLAKKDEYIIQGIEIEEKVWKLLKKARKLN